MNEVQGVNGMSEKTKKFLWAFIYFLFISSFLMGAYLNFVTSFKQH